MLFSTLQDVRVCVCVCVCVCVYVHRTGVYTGHTGPIIQLLVLGDYLISLGADKQLLVRTIGSDRDTPKVRDGVGACRHSISYVVYTHRHTQTESPLNYACTYLGHPL